MTLPDWDISDTNNRRKLVVWLSAEIDRIDGILTDRLHRQIPTADNFAKFVQAETISSKPQTPVDLETKRGRGRPAEADELKATRPSQKNSAIRDIVIVKWIIARNWFAKKSEAKSIASEVAVSRNYTSSKGSRTSSDYPKAMSEERLRLIMGVNEEISRSATNSPGRRLAKQEIAYLEALPEFSSPK